MPRLTKRAFADLGVWMLALGVVIGLAFPFVMILLGVPGRLTLKPRFFVACVLAGIVLAAANHLLARWVVGVRVAQLSRQMRYVADVIAEATYSGDWSRCSPQKCSLAVESDDQLGEAASSFNQLISSLAGSRDVQQAMAGMSRTLSEFLDLGQFAGAALRDGVRHAGAAAGALCVAREGELEVVAVHRLGAGMLHQNATIIGALSSPEPLIIDLPPDMTIDAALLSFPPACIAVLPLHFRTVPVGVLVVAYDARPAPEALRLLTSFADPIAMALNNVLTHERFQHLAAVDPLTGAYNRRFGLQRLNEEWARSIRSGSPFGLLSLDLDHFKSVNDTHGHLAGDRALREAASAARSVLRDGDVLVRMGGEEFLVLLPGAGPGDVRLVGERVRHAIAAAIVPAGPTTVGVTTSVGGACLNHAAHGTVDALLDAADQALYASKRGGRNQLTMAPA